MNRSVWVLKLGGSLVNTPYFLNWLEILPKPASISLVIVPGGGAFADQVRAQQRQWKFDDRTAHRMALLAMQQYGLMLAGLVGNLELAHRIAEIAGLLEKTAPIVWLPDLVELDRAGFPSNWQVTSDSLSAWLAGQIEAERLVIVKSCAQSRILAQPQQLARQGILDEAFLEYWKRSGVALGIHAASDHASFARTLQQQNGCEPCLPVPQ